MHDGEVVRVRPVEARDEKAVWTFLDHLSLESRCRRFFTAAPDLSRAAHWATEANPDRAGLVAETAFGEIVGHGVFVRARGQSAEVAFEVAEDHRRRGLAGAPLDRLAGAARDLGISVLQAYVLPENADMLSVFRDHFPTQEQTRDGVICVTIPIAEPSTGPHGNAPRQSSNVTAAWCWASRAGNGY
ncbi:MAG: GNAT family N-acetyltransferase [Actinomycetota bacterium]|nr:GNAT family N-acetyltransferase [Actinomycetota bacterium]